MVDEAYQEMSWLAAFVLQKCCANRACVQVSAGLFHAACSEARMLPHGVLL